MRPAFLDRPGIWTRSGSRSYDPIRDAYAIEHHKAGGDKWDYVVLALFVFFVLFMLMGVV